MKLGIIANISRPHAASVVGRVLKWGALNSVDCRLSAELDLPEFGQAVKLSPAKLVEQSDYLLAMGGDGTMLATARLVGGSGVPILGINIGSLGFLTEETPGDLERCLDRLRNGQFELEERVALEAQVLGRDAPHYFALNDVVIEKGDISRIISLSLSANGDYICSYNADGLIVATPTGSTAYSLAVGGPILNPKMKAMIASPIAPHSLASRPLIFPVDDVLQIKVEASPKFAVLTVDGQVDTQLPTGTQVVVRAAGHTVKLVRFPENSFYAVLRSKLRWGVLPNRPDGPENP